MVSAAIESALNRPVWSALTAGDRRFAEGGSLALRFPPDIAPFAATAEDSPEAFSALRDLLAEDGRVALVTLNCVNCTETDSGRSSETVIALLKPRLDSIASMMNLNSHGTHNRAAIAGKGCTGDEPSEEVSGRDSDRRSRN